MLTPILTLTLTLVVTLPLTLAVTPTLSPTLDQTLCVYSCLLRLVMHVKAHLFDFVNLIIICNPEVPGIACRQAIARHDAGPRDARTLGFPCSGSNVH